MKRFSYLFLGVSLAVVAGLALLSPVLASPAYQLTPFPTPTPGPDGRIVYIVQEGDTAYRIAGIAGITLDEFYRLNGFSPDPVLQIGQQVLLGLATPVAGTPAPGETQVPQIGQQVTPSPTAIQDASTICALLYLDENGDGLRQETEIALADGEVSVTERLGAYSSKQTTTFRDEPVCFKDIPPGTYIITMALPAGFNRTTSLSTTIDLTPGDTSYLNFGAQPTSVFAFDIDQPLPGPQRSPLAGILGILLLLVGVGVGVYAAVRGKRKYSSQD